MLHPVLQFIMMEKLPWQKKTKREKASSLDALRAAGARRAEATAAAQSTPDDDSETVETDSPVVERARWEREAKERSDALTTEQHASIKFAMDEFLKFRRGGLTVDLAFEEATGGLLDDEKEVFRDYLILAGYEDVPGMPVFEDPYEKALQHMQEDYGQPLQEIYGTKIWRAAEGTAQVLERDGTQWTVQPGGRFGFNTGHHIVIYYWQPEKGFGGIGAARGIRTGDQTTYEEAIAFEKQERHSLAEHLETGFREADRINAQPQILNATPRPQPQQPQSQSKKKRRRNRGWRTPRDVHRQRDAR